MKKKIFSLLLVALLAISSLPFSIFAEEDPNTDLGENTNGTVETVEEIAFLQDVVIDGVTIEVSAEAGVFPAGATLSARKVTLQEQAEVDEAINEVKDISEVASQYTFDITILDADGNEIQPDTSKGSVNVSFKLAEVSNDDLATEVYHIDEEGSAQALEVATEGDVAIVETESFSLYSVVFIYITDTLKPMTTSVAVGNSGTLWSLLNELGITVETYGEITNAVSDAPTIVELTKVEEVWRYEVKSADLNDHTLTITFNDNIQKNITVRSHEHNWARKVDEENPDHSKVIIDCIVENADCPYEGIDLTATITAANATYDGQSHGAVITLSDVFPAGELIVSEIYYEGIDGTEYADSTAPTNAGKYRASFRAYPKDTPEDQLDNYIGYCDYEIAKAVITFDPLALPNYAENQESLVYNGQEQPLYIKAKAVGAKTTDEFRVVYWLVDGEADPTAPEVAPIDQEENSKTGPLFDGVLTGKDVGTYTIHYQALAEDDSNHANSEIKELKVVISPRPLKIILMPAHEKVYDATTVVEFYDPIVAEPGIVATDDVEIVVTGAFEDCKAGNDKKVKIESYTLKGEDKDNYVISDESLKETTTNILQKQVKIYWQGAGDNAYTGQAILPTAALKSAHVIEENDGLTFDEDDVKVVVEQISNGLEVPSINVNNGYEARVAGLDGEDASNYYVDPGFAEVVYNIIKDGVIVNWNKDSLVKVYNGEYQVPEIESLTGIKEEDAEHIHARVVLPGEKDAGIYEIKAELYVDDPENYGRLLENYTLDSSATTWFEIKKAPLTLTANGWITYGELYNDENGHVTFKAEGLKGEDVVENAIQGEPKFRCELHQQYAPVGVYPLSVAANSVTSKNYELNFADGEIEVFPRVVELEWYDETGKKVEDEDSYTYDGKMHTITAKVVGTDDNNKMHYPLENGSEYVDEVYVVEYEDNEHKDSNLKTDTWEYVATALELNNDNYTLLEDPRNPESDNIITSELWWYIDPLTVELEWNVDELVFNNKDQWANVTATVANAIGDDTINMTYSEGEATNVGSYTKEVVEIDNDNYTLFKDNYYLVGDLVDERIHDFKITPRSISDAKVTGVIDMEYTSEPIVQTPVVKITMDGETVTLVKDKDYTVKHKDNVNPGFATITLTGKGNYKDSKEIKFEIISLDPVMDFVTRLYNECLDRNPDKDGLKYWTDLLKSGKATAAEVAQGFFNSPEMKNKDLSNEEFVETVYKALADRNPDAGGKKYWSDKLEKGVSKDHVLKGFVDSKEFTDLCKSFDVKKGTIELTEPRDKNYGITSFVARCYTKALGRDYDVDGLNYHTNNILSSENQKQTAIDTATNNFFHSPEFLNKKTTNNEFIKICYRTFLDREPEPEGMKYYTERLNAGVSRDEVMKGFANSPEFNKLLESYGIK